MSSLYERISPVDILEFSNDFIPSLALSTCIIYSFFSDPELNACYPIFKSFFDLILFINLTFIVKGLVRIWLVYLDRIGSYWSKVSLNAWEGIILS